ncbi:MAG: ATP-binding cassette domain-containing protein [Actinomycetaceae bacterium]|nr:ATP-binding cassette domain-containing protein [Actinomycetaceae bacterium]MDY5855259.1 ATP-binding cassette domain-containing protein [Arcanobacterium sp.]
MITFFHVSKRRKKLTILDDISFTVQAGRVSGFLGENGAGKSSSLRILLGLDRPTAGEALIDGKKYCQLKNPLRLVGSALGGAGAHPARSARNHLTWIALSNGISLKRVDEVLSEVGLSGQAHRKIGEFSLGMAQRLGIAAALIGRPEILIFDEPLNGLDPEGIRWFRDLVRAHAASGGTVLLSSHVISELEAVADDVIVIHRGRIVGAGSISELTRGHVNLESAFFALTDGSRP